MNISKAQGAQACDCTKIEQDETCPVGFPSLLCDMCDGKGVVPYIKLDGPELWEIVFGVNSDAASALSDADYQKIATAIDAVFIAPLLSDLEASPSLAPPSEPVNTTALIQALSRMIDNRHSDRTSSIVSAEDRSTIINTCQALTLAARQSAQVQDVAVP